MMKRPKLEYAENCTLIHTYARKLEEYCDELEKNIEVLEKELDKAFDVIVELNDCTNLSSEKYGHCPFEKRCNNGLWHASNCISNKENWKELLMKDE